MKAIGLFLVCIFSFLIQGVSNYCLASDVSATCVRRWGSGSTQDVRLTHPLARVVLTSLDSANRRPQSIGHRSEKSSRCTQQNAQTCRTMFRDRGSFTFPASRSDSLRFTESRLIGSKSLKKYQRG